MLSIILYELDVNNDKDAYRKFRSNNIQWASTCRRSSRRVVQRSQLAEKLKRRHARYFCRRRPFYLGHRYREFEREQPLWRYLWTLRRMAYTPSSSSASARGRIPTPSRLTSSAIPTPGRSRASSSATATYSNPAEDSPGMSRALTDAIRANDPKQHRVGGRPNDRGPSPRSSPSSQSGASSFTQSTRASAPRPSNIMTNSTNTMPASFSTSSKVAPPKTPVSATRTTMAGFTPRASTSTTSSRPESRQSNANANANANVRGKDRAFEPGDLVRIESLGMEGTLRYLGPIEGKPGVWAGVELNPGFAGRGKNDGTVSGVQYFSCAPKGGVFVAQAKLSAPIPRPSSVASSRGRTTPSLPSGAGRATPATSGRVTPSLSAGGRVTPAYSTSGRVTPARSISGRITPSSYATPPAKPRYSAVTPTSTAFTATPTVKPRKSTVADPSFTAGSRASKYIGMTAQQLQNARNGIDSPKPGSPTRSNVASPFTTPRAPSSTRNLVGIPPPGGSKARQSFGFGGNIPPPSSGTPRSARKTDMPPPPSPVSPSKRLTASSPSSRLSVGPSPSRTLTTPTSPSRRLTTPTGSELSVDNEDREARSEQVAELETRNRELQERITNLMNGKIMNGSSASVSPAPSDVPSQPPQPPEEIVPLVELEEERTRTKAAQARISELETQVRFNERAVKERESRLEAIERTVKSKEDEIEKTRVEGETRVKELSGKLQDAEALVASLKVAVDEVREGKKEEVQAIIEAKDKEIELLSAKVTRIGADWEEERKELGGQIDELRQAGQETIALYEEKLGEADNKRWELEDVISELEEKVRNQKRPDSPATASRHVSEAAQIDNETLREQVVHYERRISQLETQLDNVRDTADKEEQAMRTRISKYKENDAALKRELLETRTEVETRKRTEVAGKARLEELEEALRENAVALENARAEIEGLRTELGNLEAIQAGAVAANNAKVDEDSARRAVEKAKQSEINQLKELLESSRVSKREALEQYETAKQEAETAKQRAASLESTLQALESDKAELERLAEDRGSRLAAERKNLEHLKRDLDNKISEIEQLRRTTGKEKAESVNSRKEHSEEEIAGFKHIIQQLNKENFEIASQLKRIEADKKLLQEECDELREAVKILEANVNDELNKLEGFPESDDVQKALRDSKAKHELELNRLRQKLHEAEQKHAQVVNNLNKEVSELESLVESKIYREDELERDLERYKDKLARATRKSSKASGDSSLPPPPKSSRSNHPISERPSEGDVCEICEQPGHDIFSCHLLKDDLAAASGSQAAPSVADSDNSDLWCEDCESYGHVAADCPHSMEVF